MTQKNTELVLYKRKDGGSDLSVEILSRPESKQG